MPESAMSPQDALVAVMVASSASDENMRTAELVAITRMVNHMPAFATYDPDRIQRVTRIVLDLFEEEDGLAALFGLIVVGGLLWAARGRAPYAVLAAAAWTALIVHSLSDHLLEYTVVVLAAGITLGWAAASRSEELEVPEGERPVPE